MPLPTGYAATPAASAKLAERPRTKVRPTINGQLPLRFERAVDGASERFVARGDGYLVDVTGRQATLVLRTSGSKPAAVTMRLVGSRNACAAVARKPLPGVTNHLTGNDQTRWRLGIRGYGEVEYPEVYPGVSVVYYGSDRQLEYDFVVAPRATHMNIALAFGGSKGQRIDSNGQLVIATERGNVIQRRPVLYQDIDGERHTVDGAYAIRADGTVGFSVGSYDTKYPLVIDPVLSYSTYLGGSAQERANGIAIDSHGNIIIVGETYSADFPTMNAAQGRAGFGDVFVAKLTPSGDALVYATYLGGSSNDSANGVDVDAAGNAYVVGSTESWNFPTLNAIQSPRYGTSDAFVAKVDPSGTLVYSTLLGGNNEDYGYAVALDAQGRAHVVGSTISSDFPIVNPPPSKLSSNLAYRTLDSGETWTGIKTGLNSIGVLGFAFDLAQPSVMYAATQAEGVLRSEDGGTTWMSASDNRLRSPVYALAVASGSPGAVYAGTQSGVYRSYDRGQTWTDLQIPLPISSLALADDGTLYAGSFSSSIYRGVVSSRDGGNTWDGTSVGGDVHSLAVSGATVYAATDQGLFTSSNGQDWSSIGGTLPFATVVAVDPTDPAVAYAGTFTGLFKTTSRGTEWSPIADLAGTPISAVAIAPSDPATLFVSSPWGGVAVSNDSGSSWRLAGPPQLAANTFAIHPQMSSTVYAAAQRTWDAYVAIVSADGGRIEFSTFLGGTRTDEATGVAVDTNGNTYITGDTQSEDFPVLHPVQATFGGLTDVFVVKLSESGAPEYGTYLGGWGSDYYARIGVDAAGRAHVSGLTWSMFNFPVANACQPTAGGGYSDAFVSVLNEAGDGFVYSTYLGGSDMENDSTQSIGPVLAVTPAGDTYIAGTTKSANFPTSADAFQSTLAGMNDAFVARLDPTGHLRYSTLLGGSGEDNPRDIAIDTATGVVVTGYSTSADWPMVAPLQSTLMGTDDGFIARITEETAPSDTLAPTTTITTLGSEGLSGWYRSSIEVTLSAVDTPEGSGVRTIEYALGAGAFQPYAAPFTIADSGVTRLTARATDNAGNVENPAKSLTVRIDAAPPVVAISSPEPRDYQHNDAVTLGISASDVPSGVAPGSVSVTLDGVHRTIGETIKLLSLPLGTHTVVASASDIAGNASQQTATFRVVATIDSLTALVNVFGDNGLIDAGSRKTLVGMLTDAQQALQRGNPNAARGTLQDFIAYCTDQRGKKISAGAADTLVTDTRYVLGTI
jgi:photosystem II stability/assembly factor-like uncharacterized protein